MTRWLLVGALGVETLPVVRRLSRARPRSPRLVVGGWGGDEVGVLTVGVGPDKARRRTRAALDRFTPDALVSFGTCGALVDGIPVASMWGGATLRADGRPVADLDVLPGFAPACVTTVARPCWTAAERARLAAAGATLVEMEAASVFAAREEAAPQAAFFVAKVVSDLAGGDPDDLGGEGAPPVSAKARFLTRAARLMDQHLAPGLLAALRR